MFGMVLKFVCGFLSGAVTGAVTASLLTPKSGDAIRNDIKNGIDEIKLDYETGKQKKREDLEADVRKRWGE